MPLSLLTNAGTETECLHFEENHVLPFGLGVSLCLTDGARGDSTKTGNRREALRIVTEWEEAAQRRLTEAPARRVLSDIHEVIHGAPLESPTVAAYVDQWLARKRGEITWVTAKFYEHTATEFREWLGDKATQPIH